MLLLLGGLAPRARVDADILGSARSEAPLFAIQQGFHRGSMRALSNKSELGSDGVSPCIFSLNLIFRKGQQLHRIILLHIGLVTFGVRLPKRGCFG